MRVFDRPYFFHPPNDLLRLRCVRNLEQSLIPSSRRKILVRVERKTKSISQIGKVVSQSLTLNLDFNPRRTMFLKTETSIRAKKTAQEGLDYGLIT
jgi:hypothetical protein